MSFAYPWVLLFFPLILLSLFIRWRRTHTTLAFPSFSLVQDIQKSWRIKLRTPLLGLLGLIALSCLSLAAARPQRTTIHPSPLEARNVLIALDLSRSMETADFNYDGRWATRLDGVKSVVDDLLKNRLGDRIGLVVFGVQAFLQAPLTLDHALLTQMVSSLECGVAGDGTAIGDGLGLSVKRLEGVPAKAKSVILITDGVNNSGNVHPLKAAQVAKDLNITVHTIGIGSERPTASGAPEFDEKLLKEIAEMTGGLYSSASSSEDLRKIYQAIEQLEMTESNQPSVKEIDELFHPFAFTALLAFMLLTVLARSYFLKVPVV